jgi:hypothetical protein
MSVLSDLVERNASRWWDADEDEVHKRLVQVGKDLEKAQASRVSDGWRHYRLFAGMRPDMLTAFGALGFVSADKSGPGRLPRFSFNVIQSVIETATNRVATNEIRPTAQTTGADWDLQERAELLTQFTDGIAYENDFRELAVDCAEDSMILGTGVEKSYLDRGRVVTERIFPLEILVDDEDGLYGKPRQIVHRRQVPRDVLLAQFPKKEKVIRSAPLAENNQRRKSVADVVMVWEAWHLPSGPDEKDGKWAICVENGDLDSGEWTRPTFPFRFLHWKKPKLGFWGHGIAEQLTGIQIEINRVVKFAQESLSAGGFKVFLAVGSKVVKSHLNKEIGGMVEYVGAKPDYVTPEVLSGQVMQWLLELYRKAYELVGISAMAAQAIKPAGLDSKPALRAYDDIQDSRFTRFGKRYETWHREVAEDWIELGREAHKQLTEGGDKKGFVVKTPGTDGIAEIPWKDINLQREQFVFQIFAESALPKTPAARRQTIQEYMQANLMTPEEGRRELRMPDLKSATDLDDAPRNLVLYQIGKMRKGVPQTFEDGFQDPVLAQTLVNQAYQLGRVKNLPEDRLELFRAYLSQLDALMKMKVQQQTAPGPGGPMAKPEAPPTSPMLPNVPGGAPPAAA